MVICGYLWLSVPWTHPAGCYHLLYWWRAPQKPPFITRKLVHYPEIRLWFPVCSHREMLRLSGDGWRVVAAELQPSTRPTWGFMHIYSTGYILLYILQVISWPKCKTRQNKGTMNSSWAERHKPRVHVPEASLLWQSADGCQGDRTEAGSGLKVHEEASWRGIREKPSEGTVTLTACPLSSTGNWLRRSTRRSTPAGGELRSRHFQKVSVDVLNVRNTLLFLWYSTRASWVSLLFSESNWVPVKHSFNAFPPTVRRAERAEPARVRLSQSAARIARTLEGRRQNRSRTSQNQNCTVRKQQTWRLVHRHAYTQRAHRRRLSALLYYRTFEFKDYNNNYVIVIKISSGLQMLVD